MGGASPEDIARAAAAEMRMFLKNRQALLRELGSSFSAPAFCAFERTVQWRDYSHSRGAIT